jgi:hypothetical protein
VCSQNEHCQNRLARLLDSETGAPTGERRGIFRPCGFGEGPDEAPFVKELLATYLGP